MHTIELNLNALEQFSPKLISFYKELSTKAVTIAKKKRGSISKEQKKKLFNILKKK